MWRFVGIYVNEKTFSYYVSGKKNNIKTTEEMEVMK